MSDDALTVGSIDLTGLAPIKPGSALVAARGSCRECFFSHVEGGDRVCRFYPPQVTFIAVPETKMVPTQHGPRPQQVVALRNFSGFPVVQHEAWCGQYRHKIGNG
jgi:hypothetical protein